MTTEPRFTVHDVGDAGGRAAAATLFAAYAEAIGFDVSWQRFDEGLAAHPEHYAPPHGALLLARLASGAAVGAVALRGLDIAGPEERCGEMKRLFVTSAARGLGIGAALIAAVIARAEALGYARLVLDTRPSMHEAIALYARAGFLPAAPYGANIYPDALFFARPLRSFARC